MHSLDLCGHPAQLPLTNPTRHSGRTAAPCPAQAVSDPSKG